MNYSKIQKFLSSLIIFSLLFGTTFRIPLLQYSTYASSKDFFSLVAVVVEEEIYSDIKSEVVRYSEDIQGVLENTRVVILPTPGDTPAFNVASMLEGLYFDGYNGLSKVDFESQLIGTVLVGDFNIPKVYSGEDSSKTILPFTDFIDKKYIYNNQTKKYEENSENIDGVKSEIWHGIISPNLGNENDNKNAIKDYFDKNHDFYKGTGNFKYSEGIINANNTVGVKSDYEPYVFYFDNFRENASLNYNSYESYLAYLENKEDIVYDRFTKEVAEKITKKLLGSQSSTISKLINNVDPTFDISGMSNAPDTSLTPDIQTRNIIEEATNFFIEAFSEGTIGEFRSDVHNAGRYNGEGSKVNADFIPYLITVLDLVNDEIVKEGNTLLENKIDEIVKTSLQKDIYIPISVKHKVQYVDEFGDIIDNDNYWIDKVWENFLYGNQTKNILEAKDCSIYRGSFYSSGKLVEANRAYNFTTIEKDVEKLKNEDESDGKTSKLYSCMNGIEDKTSLVGYWGGNTALNSDFTGSYPTLLEHDVTKSITNLFDITGTIKIENLDGNYPSLPVLKNGNSYKDCFEENFLYVLNQDEDGDINYRPPLINDQDESKDFFDNISYSCKTSIDKLNYSKSYIELDNAGKCIGNICHDNEYLIEFKKISSIVEHKSPSFEEIDKQMKNMISSSLPVDKDRYIDFKAENGYQKINYPYLFRLGVDNGEELNFTNIKKHLEEYLNQYDSVIGEKLFDYLNDQDNEVGIKGTYIDTLSFGIYWNNLGASGKYKFVFENYLSDQDGGNNFDFSLARNKNQYEIAYLGSKGDASNMYVLLDPKSKEVNPYADILAQNESLKSSILGTNINKDNNNSGDSNNKCAPPEGVPLWEWFPAIMCRIADILPPTISINNDSCSSTSENLSKEDLQEIIDNGGDKDKNGIIDCIESKLLGGSLELKSDASKYYYGTIGKLRSEIKDSNGNVVKLDSSTKINFELIKVYVKKDDKKEFSNSNRKLIYNKNEEEGSELNNEEALGNLQKYIDFVPGEVRASYGIAEKSFVVKNSDADFIFRTNYEVENFNREVELFQESEDLIINVRGDKLFTTSYKISNTYDGSRTIDLGLSSILVSNQDNIFLSNIDNFSKDKLNGVDSKSTSKEKLILNLTNIDNDGNNIDLEYPIEISVFNNNNEIFEYKQTFNNLNGITSLGSFKKSGSYEFVIKDKFGYSLKKQIEILPEIASKIEINNSTSIIEKDGNIITNVFTIYDEYGNVANGDFYSIELDIEGDGMIFETENQSEEQNREFTIYDGYKIFKLVSTDRVDNNIISYLVKDFNGNELFRESKEIKTVEKIYTVLKPLFSDITIGGGEYSYEVSFRDSSGNIIEDFDSRVYLNIPTIYGTSTQDYFEVVNGKTFVSFNTKNISNREINIELQVEGISNIIQRNITILPEKPVLLDLYLSNDNIEASDTSYSNLRVELKDRFGNLVFNDSSTVADIDILDKYSNVIYTDNSSEVFDEGIAYFKINATQTPGIAYFKISTNPSLENNFFKVIDNNGELTIYGVGETAGQISSSYFWNKDNIDGKKYNALYTTLLGSNYGDITQKDYLAGSLLFDKDNRALGVTSLINNPYETNNIININQNGNINKIYNNSDLTQDIAFYTSFVDNKITFDIYNEALNNYIGNIYYNFSDNTNLNVCNISLEECELNNEETSIFTQNLSIDYNTYLDGDELIFEDRLNNKIFSINTNGEINKASSVDFIIDDNNSNDYLLLNIIIAGEIIGKLGFNFIDNVINISRDENIFENKIKSLSNSILVLLNSNLYLPMDNINNKIIYYNDPFASKNKINDFSVSNMDSYENFINKKGLGWSEGNKTLLEFSSGKSIGESVKDYMSFGVINLGDPVVSLKKIKEKLPKTSIDRKFDSTIGTLISNNSNVQSYEVFDYNNDNKEDLLLIKRDGFLQLLENKDIRENFLDKGDLANIVDLGDVDSVKTGDFSGDGYDDIFFVNKDGKAYLLNNNTKDFNRIDLSEQFDLEGKIIIARVFDMDNDSIDDIITLDDAGSINIFYGGGTGNNPSFTKNTINDEFGLLLGDETRNDNGLVYYDGLYQLEQIGDNSDLLASSQEYLAQENNDEEENSNKAGFSYDVVDNIVFERLSYNPDKKATDNAIGEYSIEDFANIQALTEDDLVAHNFGDNNIDYISKDTTFIKSEYSESSGIKVEKKFRDINAGFLKADDIIDIDITLTNLSNKTIKNIAYGERLNEIFTLDKKSIITDEDSNLYYNVPTLTFLVNNFDLYPGESFNITFTAKTKPLDYGYINVGLFEKGELGNDEYGDIIFSKDNQNCSEDVDIFRSMAARDYQEGTKSPECDSDSIKLLESLAQNALDTDNNGIPDYIDKLSDPDNIDELQAYSEEKLNDFNDSSSYKNDKPINDQIESALENADTFIESLSCGFGSASCIATPLNWAPLAPGGDPTMFGYPTGDGFNVDEGLPIFSAFTFFPYGPFCGPAVWPPSPLTAGCSGLGAGGMLGVNNTFNFFRLFVTPTLTGGLGTAICFGGPASVAGVSNPEGVSPINPGGNCIVLAKPLAQCSDDGSDGDVSSIGFSGIDSSNYELFNGNCDSTKPKASSTLSSDLVNDYYDYKKTGNKNSSLDSDFGTAFDKISNGTSLVNETPLIGLGTNGEGGDIDVSVNFAGALDGNFSDVIQISKTRIFSFPQFLMEWVTRQVEEIANKLTDFPTLFIILPDFTGILDGIGAESEDDLDSSKTEISDKIGGGELTKKTESGIKDAYNFLSSVPIIKFEKEIVNINFPWIDGESLDRTWNDRTLTVQRRKEEIIKFKDSATFGTFCNQTDKLEKEKCEEQNSINNKIVLDAQALVLSLEKNIATLEEYKKTPEKIYNWLNVKERYLEQILCNIESISELMGGWISKNGIRFKAWVNLYILIKAVLKSWQGLIDLFLDYEAECHECKNERMDLMTFIFGLISMVIPKIPVIQFPKWPDIILDLHNIRVSLSINLPEFNVNERPILLPYLPELILPSVPNVNINLPELPLLPTFEIPEMPDIPSLPRIELPDLPPPPTLPSLLSSLQGILDILKLITKVMCILKKSPFVPEWRAGDQISFLTERQGYLGLDFLFGISTPQFSFPFVDAIKVSTYVNLEFEVDFIVELSRQAAMPINNFTNNIVNLFNYSTLDVDLTEYAPSDIDINIGGDGDISGEIGLNKVIDKKELLALILVKNFKKLFNHIEINNNELISITEFQQNINNELAGEDFIGNPKTAGIRKIWDNVNNYTYSKENKLIKELEDNNKQKFGLIKDIINTEIINNKNFIKELDDASDKTSTIKVAYNDNKVDIDYYNDQLEGYNQNVINATKKIINSNETEEIRSELKEISGNVVARIKGGLNSFVEGQDDKILSFINSPTTSTQTEPTSCQFQSNSDYKYNYEGLYIVENEVSYRLFDYLNELDGNEKTTVIDFDNDQDEDLLYMTNGEIFIKENLENKDIKNFVSTNPIILKSNDNKFLNGDIFYEAINNFESGLSENNFINFSFKNSNNIGVNNYRIELFNIVDKFLNIDNNSYTPNNILKSIIDGFSGIDDLTINREQDELFTFRNNLGYIKNVGNLVGLKLKTYEFKNIKDDIIDNNLVTLTSGTILYSGKNDVIIDYFEESAEINQDNLKSISIGKYSNVEIKNSIKIQSINSDAYVNTDNIINIEGANISKYIGLPLLAGTKIDNIDNSYSGIHPRYIEIKYYDGTNLNLDFAKILNYELYDLGPLSNESYIRINRDNDYLYAKIRAFNNNEFSTYSNQIVIYPQNESDKSAPELSINSIIKIPVYQKKIVDLTSYVYEDSGIKNIKEIFIDFDLESDSDGDGNTKNDRDTNNINILHKYNSIKVEFGEYDNLFNKKIGIGLIDNNGNSSYREVDFLVYPPVPEISLYNDGVITGEINEALSDEPINLYRYRGGMITKLSNENGDNSINTVNGEYNFEISDTRKGLNLYNGDNIVAYIDENSGGIKIIDFNSKINILSSNDISNNTIFPKIILSNNEKEIYYQYLELKGAGKVNLIDDIENVDELSDKGIYISFSDKTSYNYYVIPDGSEFDPGTFIVYRNIDKDKQGLFTIFTDGRINTINDYYTLEYFESNGNIGYKLIDKHFNKEVARVLININGEYIIK